jgi:hypothetical protein
MVLLSPSRWIYTAPTLTLPLSHASAAASPPSPSSLLGPRRLLRQHAAASALAQASPSTPSPSPSPPMWRRSGRTRARLDPHTARGHGSWRHEAAAPPSLTRPPRRPPPLPAPRTPPPRSDGARWWRTSASARERRRRKAPARAVSGHKPVAGVRQATGATRSRWWVLSLLPPPHL